MSRAQDGSDHMLRRLADRLDALIDGLGRALAWMTAAMVVLMLAIVVLRYGFGRGSVALQEAVLYLHGAVFLLGASWALTRNAHVRVDVLQQRWSARARAAAELAGTLLFLLPFCVLLVWLSWDYAARSWAIAEGSKEPGGLPWVYLFKSLIPAGGILLALAGLAQGLRAVAALRGGAAMTAPADAGGTGA